MIVPGATPDAVRPRRGPILAIDTATSLAVLALGDPDGRVLDGAAWAAGRRHGETLLPSLERLLTANDVDRATIAAVVVGTGPGTFTGLRVGLATAKGLAIGLGVPLVAVPTSAALLATITGSPVALLQPAGPQGRLLVHDGRARELGPDESIDLPVGTILVAVDLDGRAPDAALELGRRACARLGESLLRIGAARLAARTSDDAAAVVPEYVTRPRGVRREGGEVEWSRDRR